MPPAPECSENSVLNIGSAKIAAVPPCPCTCTSGNAKLGVSLPVIKLPSRYSTQVASGSNANRLAQPFFSGQVTVEPAKVPTGLVIRPTPTGSAKGISTSMSLVNGRAALRLKFSNRTRPSGPAFASTRRSILNGTPSGDSVS